MIALLKYNIFSTPVSTPVVVPAAAKEASVIALPRPIPSHPLGVRGKRRRPEGSS